LVYAGNRANEFEARLQGVTYEEIARQGGGIQSTVNATRKASEEELFSQSIIRAQALLNSGVTTLEIKSGYGLDWPTELKILQVAKRIEDTLPITVFKTFLGAHTIPAEYRGKTDQYVDLICDEMIPQIAKEKLASAVDVFCEKIAFNIQQTERIFQAAKANGLGIKCHAEQLSDSGSVMLAAKYKALSVDHLEHASDAGIKAISTSGTVAVLLPGAFYFLRETKLPPIALLRKHRVPMAIATDCNPGTSPIMSLLIMLNMACTIFRLTPNEALAGVTRNAAKALGIETTHGTLTVGKVADFAIWDVEHAAELAYYMGNNPLFQLVKNGVDLM
jgi:imidazolonepropionase